MQQTNIRAIALLNLSMLLVGTSGPLGRFIALPPPITIWYRSLIAFLILGGFCWIKKYTFKVDGLKNGRTIALSGLLLGLHWVTYFFALKWGNVAIGMLSMFTYPIMTTFLEPLFFQTKLQRIHLVLGLFILIGVYLLAPSLDWENQQTKGVLMGLISALAFALRNLLLKTKIGQFNGSILMFYQMGIVLLALSPVLFWHHETAISTQLPYLLVLGIITTAIGHTMFLTSFKHFSVGTASILSSVQPIYGIIIAVFTLGEIPNWQSILGGATILSAVIIESRRQMSPAP